MTSFPDAPDIGIKPPRRRLAASQIMTLMRSRMAMSLLSFGSKLVIRAGTFLIIAPLIGPTKQGIIVATQTWSTTILLLAGFGLSVRALREFIVRRNVAFGVLVADLRVMAALSLPSLAILLFVAIRVLPEYATSIFLLMFVAGLGTLIGDYCSSILRAFDRYASEAVLSAATSLMQMGGAVGAALYWGSVASIAWAILIVRVVCAVVSLGLVLLQEPLRSNANWSLEPFHKTLRSSAPYFLDGSLSTILTGLDIMVLTEIVSASVVGTYSAGSRLVQLFVVAPWIILNAVGPTLAKAEGTPSFVRQAVRLSMVMAFVALVGVATLVLGGPSFAHYVLRDRFSGLNILWLGFAFQVASRFYEGLFGILLISTGRLRSRVLMQAIAVPVISLALVELVPKMGVFALSYVIAAFNLVLGCFYATRFAKDSLVFSRLAFAVGVMLLAAAGLCCWMQYIWIRSN